ncbi:gastrula zinc finger protein XlCGF16.1-like [Bufo bufo]|uniref:gastrula zinc finger protein XlCGF16.1-like n=1 Tax=Bufo bufo TaxID=8384 RepID=UPI001ABE59C2|nr:gastrula zinc finger protein XlCGF16.1-like [Bufo bufo]
MLVPLPGEDWMKGSQGHLIVTQNIEYNQSQLGINPTGHNLGEMSASSEYGRDLKNKCNLSVHKEIQKDERTFSCSEREKMFNVLSSFAQHQRNSTGEKPYSCSECEKTFTVKSSLLRHLRIHTGEKPFSCQECGELFKRKHHLELHMRSHTGEKPFLCSECGKVTVWFSILLDNHVVTTMVGVQSRSIARPELKNRF